MRISTWVAAPRPVREPKLQTLIGQYTCGSGEIPCSRQQCPCSSGASACSASAHLGHIADCENDPREAEKHGNYIGVMIEQCVRREAFCTSQQKPLRRPVENIVLGDARKRGETHQWMYDWVHLKTVLLGLKFSDVRRQQYNTSLIPRWNDYGLDLDENSNEYKPESLYVEAIK